MSAPLLLDTGGWLYALAGEAGYAEALQTARPAVVPSLVLAEVDFHLRRRRGDMKKLMREIERGAYIYEPASAADLSRAMQIDAKFAGLQLGLVDASIVALAERLRISRVLTIDSDFSVVRFGRSWRSALELAVPLPSH